MFDGLLVAIALMLLLEGLLPLASPRAWRQVFERALGLRDGQLRFLGLISVASGLALLLLIQR